ncbi:histone-lysine N-methyltransferase EHMT2-like, partial [Oenanthe melanoleuca]|uniref:histone-lysine N-methyltransferase EHMT2-like n=1 Tax=Oenanthe melanoleuca TaxID=2939378 RepID=UPI0024C103C9
MIEVDNLDPNFQSDAQSKGSALHAAAQKGHLEICHLLLQAGANINAVDKQRCTLLMEAVAHDQLEAARRLRLQQRGGLLHLPAPRGQKREPGDGGAAAEHGAGGCQCTGQRGLDPDHLGGRAQTHRGHSAAADARGRRHPDRQ